MCYLGFWPQAISFLRRTRAGLREGVYAQAHEFYGPNRRNFDAPVRIAMREECMRESSAGGAFAETVITTLFGYDARLGHDLALYDPAQNRGFSGELLHVRHGEHQFTLRSAPAGVSLMRE
jgi:2-hydroxychromene-2-carboxylate isomerase